MQGNRSQGCLKWQQVTGRVYDTLAGTMQVAFLVDTLRHTGRWCQATGVSVLGTGYLPGRLRGPIGPVDRRS